MTRTRRALCAIAAAVVLGACQRGQNGESGGPAEARLMDAVVAGDPGRVRRELDAGANPNKMTPFEGHQQAPWKIALHRARSDRPETLVIVHALLDAGADPEVAWGDEPSRRGGYAVLPTNPVLEAVSQPDVVRALLAAHLDPRLAQVALELAVENGETDSVHALVEAGVDVNTTKTAVTPLVAAIEHRNVALMTYLEDHGAREKP